MSEKPDFRDQFKRSLTKIAELKAQIAALETDRSEQIAVVGMSCRFPGANSPEQFWQVLDSGQDRIREIPSNRSIAEWPIGVPRWAGLLDQVDQFDANFFGISPREALSLDPQQRLVLEVAWEALERAGIVPLSIQRAAVGVFLGLCTTDYYHRVLRLNYEDRDMYSLTGNIPSTAAGRLSYTLGLQGPAVTLDTACSSSLVAIHLACRSLISQESTLAIAGGVHVIASEESSAGLSRTQALSPEGRCKTFDASANGFVRGEGCGMLVLERLSDANKNGHPVLAVIRGSAVNQDGKSTGLTAPNVLSQQALLRSALVASGLNAEDVSYIECHGTATPLGDPIEVEAIRAVLGRRTSPLWLGAVKSNIGHLEAAAGVAGVMKIILAMQHRMLPPNLHLRHLNPRLELEGTQLVPLTVPTPWDIGSHRRVAGVSSFGLSGTNAHIILEEPSDQTRPESNSGALRAVPLLLSGQDPEAVRQQAEQLAAYLGDQPHVALADVSYTLMTKRSHFSYRASVAAKSTQHAIELLAQLATPTVARTRPKIAILFTGQGAQYRAMGKTLYEAEPRFSEALDEIFANFDGLLDRPLRDVLFSPDDAEDAIDQTLYAQPALFALEVALYRFIAPLLPRPIALLGHSIGEISAAHVGGVFSLADACKLVAARGKLMQALPAGGAMASIQASEVEVAAALEGRVGVDIAAVNGITSTVISGDADVVMAVVSSFEAQGRKVKRLTVSHAFHSGRMEPMLAEFRRVLEEVSFASPTLAVISNLDGEVLDAARACDVEYWVNHVRRPVRFVDGVQALERRGVGVFLELGPHGVLTAMAEGCFTGDNAKRMVSCLRKGTDDGEAVSRALGALFEEGLEIRWGEYYGADAGRSMVNLPTYPFQRQQFWLVPPVVQKTQQHGEFALSGHRTVHPKNATHAFEIGPTIQKYLIDHIIYGVIVVPGAFYTATFLAVAATLWPDRVVSVEQVDFLRSVTFASQSESKLAEVQLVTEGPHVQAEFWTFDGDQWTLNASATLSADERHPRVEPAPSALNVENIIPGLDEALRSVQVVWGDSWWRIPNGRVAGDEAIGLYEVNESERKEAPLAVREIDNAFGLVKLVLPGTADAVPLLPFSLGRLSWYGSNRAPHLVSTRVRPRTGNAEQIVADLTFWDQDGQCIAEIDAFSMRRAPAERFLSETHTLETYAVSYAEVKVTRAASTGTRVWLGPWGAPESGAHTWSEFMASLENGVPDRVVLLGFAEGSTPTAEGVRETTIELLHVLQEWLADERLRETSLTVVTRRAVAVLDGQALSTPQTGIPGLLRTVHAEYPDLRLQHIDLDEWSALDVALTGDCGEWAWVVRAGQVLAPGLQRLSLEPTQSLNLDETGTVLISGGTGALGAAVAAHLVEHHGARRLVLLSRRGIKSEGAEELQQRLTGLGAIVEIIACDVADAKMLESALATIPPEHPVTEVFHIAGTLADSTLEALTDEQVTQVFAPKVDGAVNLYSLTANQRVSTFVLFSSIAGWLGSAGQGNYSAANTATDAFALELRRRGTRAFSIAWGFWEEGGMAAQLSNAEREKLRRRGLIPFSNRQGLEVLDRVLCSDAAVVAAARLDLSLIHFGRSEGRDTRSSRSTLPGGQVRAGGTGFAEALRASPESHRERMALELVLREATSVLGLANGTLDPKRALQEAGLDSLMAVELRNQLKSATKLPLAPTLLFDYPTPEALARYLIDEIQRLTVTTTQPAAAPFRERRSETDEVAIVGMACRFPGQTNSPEELWEVLQAGRDVTQDFPYDRGWDVDALYDPDPGAVGHTVTRRGGFISHPDMFDALFFGISPREATLLDPQHRLLLELAWEGLERARIVPDSLENSLTGVWMGLGYNEYAKLVPPPSVAVDGYGLLGTAPSIAAGRIAYTLGLQGPTMTLDTACSSGLVAIHLAREALLERETDLAIVGASTVFATPDPFVGFSRMRTLSPDGRCRSFSAGANGAAWAEGAGVLILERVADARKNGHPILAVVRGSAINQDGRSQGLTAPNGPSQQRVIRAALKSAELDAEDVDVVEAHGTATKLGDPIEAQALGAVYGQAHDAKRPLWLGSIKSNIGHTQSAAGIAGVIKLVMALRHDTLPKTLHAEEPTPEIDWAGANLRLLQTDVAWPQTQRPRYGGVSSFGISGTNAHVIIGSEPLERQPIGGAVDTGSATATGPSPIILSGRTEKALAAQADELNRYLQRGEGKRLEDLAFSLATTRTCFEFRACIIANDIEHLRESLLTLAAGTPHAACVDGRAKVSGKLVFVFPGQGSQWVAMAKALLLQSAVFCSAMEECAAALDAHTDWSLMAVVQGRPDAASLERVDVVQPALFAMMVSLAKLWKSFGVAPDAVIGHSQGEIAAACVAGILSLEDAAAVVAIRSKIIAERLREGAMAATSLSATLIAARLGRFGDRIALAVDNGPASTVVSGDPAAIDELVAELEAEGIFARRIRVTYASHCAHIEDLQEPLLDALRGINPRAGDVRMKSTVSCDMLEGHELTANYWYTNLRKPVRFADAVGSLLEDGYRFFVEISPHPVLSLALNGIFDSSRALAAVVGTLRRDDGGLARAQLSLGELHCHGYPVDWREFFASQPTQALDLPTYAFQRERFWVDVPDVVRSTGRTSRGVSKSGHPILGEAFRVSTDARITYWEQVLAPTEPSWVADHAVQTACVFPGAGLAELMLAGARELSGSASLVVRNLELRRALVLARDEHSTIQLALVEAGSGRAWDSIVSLATGREWTKLASARVEVAEWDAHSPTVTLSEVRAKCIDERTAAELYGAAAAMGLTLGPAFHGVEAIWMGPQNTALGRVVLPAAAGRADGYMVHPALLDACFQVSISALVDTRPDGGPFVPTSIERIQLAQPLGSHPLWVCATTTVDPQVMRSDLWIWTENGDCVGLVQGFRAEPLERSHAETDPLAELLHETVWQAVETPSPIPTVQGERWLILGDQGGLGARLAPLMQSHGVDVELVDANDLTVALSKPVTGVVCLWALDSRPLDSLVQSSVPDFGFMGWEATLHLVQALAERREQSMPRLVFVTDRAISTDLKNLVRPEQAVVWSLSGTIRSEYPAMRSRRIDVDGDLALPLLPGAVLWSSDEDQIAIRDGAVFVARLNRAREIRPLQYRSEAASDRPYRLEVSEPGKLDSLHLVGFEPPPVGPRQVEIEVEAAGLNFEDVLAALGEIPPQDEAGVALGAECAGRIAALGDGVVGLELGQRVLALVPGAFSTRVVASAALVLPLPSSLSFAEAVTLPVVGVTVLYALEHVARLRRGERVLIHSAAGGIGIAALEWARHVGAEIYATAGTLEKEEWLRSQGLTYVSDSRSDKFFSDVQEWTNNEGVDVVLNGLSGPLMEKSLDLLRGGGRFVESGKRDYMVDRQIGIGPFLRGLSFTLVDIATMMRHAPQRIRELFIELTDLVHEGVFHPLPFRTFELSSARDAFGEMGRDRDVGKYVFNIKERTTPVIDLPVKHEFSRDASYVITGGLGGLGLSLAGWMSENGAGHVVLIGRRSVTSDVQRAAIAAMQARGTRVSVEALDVSDHAALKEGIERIPAELPLRGVVHAAGVLDDAMITNQTSEKFQNVMQPKAGGAWNLHLLTLERRLDFFVLYSSVAAVLTTPGQANYSAANAFLVSLAHHRRYLGLPGLAINWGGFSDVGLAAQDQIRGARLRSLGIELLTPERGLELFSRLIWSGVTEIVAMPLDRDGWCRVYPAHENWHFLEQLATARSDGKEEEERWRLNSLDTAIELVTGLVAKIVRMDPARIGRDVEFPSLGLDSLMSMEVRNRLQRLTGLELPAVLLLEHRTPRLLAAALLRQGSPEEVAQARPLWRDDLTLADGLTFATHGTQSIRQVLLTGATGFMGAHILAELWTQHPTVTIHVVVRAQSDEHARVRLAESLVDWGLDIVRDDARIVAHAGDLTKPRLGLSSDLWTSLCEGVDVVIANGATVDWLQSYDALRSANVLSTVEVLELGSRGRSKRLIFVSSGIAGAVDEKEGSVLEVVSEQPVIESGYALSKFVSEQLIVAAEQRGLTAVILRPGLVSASGKTGITSVSQMENRYFQACARLRAVPDTQLGIELIPVDKVALMVVEAAMNVNVSNEILHVSQPCVYSSEWLREIIVSSGGECEVLPEEEWLKRLRDEIRRGALELAPVDTFFDGLKQFVTLDTRKARAVLTSAREIADVGEALRSMYRKLFGR